jgi:hypothetical protein
MKLGKHPPKFDKRTLQFGKYITKALPPAPVSVDYSQAVSSWPMMLNDTYGDCTCAAAGHMIEEWTANNGNEVIVPDPEILTAYKHFAGNNPDAGANMLDVLNYWRKTGIGGHKIAAFAALEPQNDMQARDAVDLFGNCYIGVALPDFAVPPGGDFLAIPWVVPPQGATGNAVPNPQNGHCIPAVGYDQRNLYVVTWGALKSMSWQFYETYMDEAFAVLSSDWISAKLGTAPPGFDLATLQQDLAAIKSAPAAVTGVKGGASGGKKTKAKN